MMTSAGKEFRARLHNSTAIQYSPILRTLVLSGLNFLNLQALSPLLYPSTEYRYP